ncbi:MAG TPA: helix-turn-helix transcriptional regulator [Acetobacteraceae bacterium]|jgi:phage repressor protein C with HTH and peptisase S24 domain
MSRVRDSERKNHQGANTLGAERGAFTTRLRTILSHWPSADRLARAMGVSPSAFRKWLRGEAEPSRERLIALADAAKVSIAWLATGEGPEPVFDTPEDTAARGRFAPGEGVDASRFILLPKAPEAAAAGAVTPPAPTNREYIAFRHDWVRSEFGIDPEDLILEIAIGESMTPTIRNGDLLLIDTTDRVFNNFGIYVLEILGERIVKRVQRKLDGSLVLISDNATYEVDQVPPGQVKDVTVVGRVVWAGGAI